MQIKYLNSYDPAETYIVLGLFVFNRVAEDALIDILPFLKEGDSYGIQINLIGNALRDAPDPCLKT
jgi:hypothetical protein